MVWQISGWQSFIPFYVFAEENQRCSMTEINLQTYLDISSAADSTVAERPHATTKSNGLCHEDARFTTFHVVAMRSMKV